MKPILVIDSNYLAHRAMFRLGNLSYEEKLTGVIFGFLRSIMVLSDKFQPSEIIFCWDSTKSWRKNIFPGYKGNRNKSYTEEEAQERSICYNQFNELQESILPRMGFANIFSQNGIEADDLIAQVVIDQPKDNGFKKHIIVSADNDLYQLLSLADMFLFDKKLLFTKQDFVNAWDIAPADWLEVKALVGDTSDNIPGLRGVGVKTAIKIFKGIDKRPNIIKSVQENADLIALNKQLMKLPFPKTRPVIVKKSQVDMFGFEQVCLENGFQWFLKREQYVKWQNVLSLQ